MIDMALSKNILPKAKHSVVDDFLKEGYKDAEISLKNRELDSSSDVLGQNRELMAFTIIQAAGESIEGIEKAIAVNEKLQEVFRDIVDDVEEDMMISCLSLCLYGHIMEIYSEEDFRYVYRYTLKDSKKTEVVKDWLLRALLILGGLKKDKPTEILSEVRNWINFLGAQLFSPNELSEPAEELQMDMEDALLSEEVRLVEALRKYSDYLEEAVRNKPYFEMYSQSNEWLPEVLSHHLLKIYRKKVYSSAKDIITPVMDIEEAHETLKKHFEEQEFRSNEDSVFPVRLQELENPPPADAVDPVVFEMIPQKLRVQLLPSVAYSVSTKQIEIIFIGGPRIGHSGILIKTDSGGILMDYGMSVANQMIPKWVPEIEMIDTVLVTHSHLDHVGALPILFDSYSGKWCSTNLTAAITMTLLEDAKKVGTPMPPRRYDKWDMVSRFKQKNIDIVSRNHAPLEVGVTSEIGPGILVTPIEACHIPGSVAYIVDIEGVRILYTGDFNLDQSMLFPGASLPNDCNVVIFDGTYWDREDFDRSKVSETFSDVIQNHGPVIIPSFAVGRSQEVLMILENLGITKSRNVIVAGMAEQVTKTAGYKGNWDSLKKNKYELDSEDVIVAGGGMMGGGHARNFFNMYRDDPKAAVILCGYLAPRTPGWNLANGHEPCKCHVEYARLSAHSSGSNLEQYIDSCDGKRVIVHTPVEKITKKLTMPEFGSRIILKT